MSFKNKLCILLIVYFQIYMLCCDEDTATQTEKTSLRFPNQINMYAF